MGVAGEPDLVKTREVPRFECVMVVVGGKQRFFAYDHANRVARFPADPFSRPQAEGLRDLMATAARERKEPMSVVRLESAINGPPKPEPKTKTKPEQPKKTGRHAPQARSH
jgi:hypothetical protein